MEATGNLESKANMPPKLEEGSETERVQIVAPSSWIKLLDDWRRRQDKIPSRSEAIRQLVEDAIGAAPKGRSKSQK